MPTERINQPFFEICIAKYNILRYVETEAKKTELPFCHIAQKILPLEKFYSPKGQNDLFQGLK